MATETERNRITSHLLDYGDQNRFRVLAARDYGSRARGLENDSSDYDVFFVFAEPPSHYALGGATDTYTKSVYDNEIGEIELHGWSLRKFIGNDGLAGSNPTAIEFAMSPEVYMQNEHIAKMCTHAISEFKPYALMNHYRSMAASNYGKYIEGDYTIADDASYDDLLDLTDSTLFPGRDFAERAIENITVDSDETQIGEDSVQVVGESHVSMFIEDVGTNVALDEGVIQRTTTDRTVKRHLNVVQSLCRARHVEDTHSVPVPMDFEEFLFTIGGADWMPGQVYTGIEDLIDRKRAGSGEDIIVNGVLNDWIESELSRDVDPEPHVKRQPDNSVITRHARDLYNDIEWT